MNIGGGFVKAHTFRVVLEPDGEGWHIYVPELRSIGASTWGYTQADALNYIKEVLEMIIEEFYEEGKSLPEADAMAVSTGRTVTVTI